MKKIILSIVTSLLLFTLTVNASETMYVIKSDGVVSGSAALWKEPGSNVFIDIVNLGEQRYKLWLGTWRKWKRI